MQQLNKNSRNQLSDISNIFSLVKPEIVRENLKLTATIRVGRSWTWDVEVIGEPITQKYWFKDDSPVQLEDGNSVSIENRDYGSRFGIAKAQRKVKSNDVLFL